MKKIELEKKYIEKFNNQKKELEEQLLEDELMAHCIDKSRPLYYQPTIVITNYGRAWSLHYRRWITPFESSSNLNYFTFCIGDGNMVRVGNLVNHYFPSESDKICLSAYGYDESEIHHKRKSIIKPELIQTREDRILYCMFINNADNLCRQEAHDHTFVDSIGSGNVPQTHDGVAVGFNVDDKVMINTNQKSYNSYAYFTYEYDSDGNVKNTLNQQTYLCRCSVEEAWNKYKEKMMPLLNL